MKPLAGFDVSLPLDGMGARNGRGAAGAGYRGTMSQRALSNHPDGVLVRVWVVPRASRTEVSGFHGGRLKVRVMAPPEAGRANEELEKTLARRLGAPVTLVAGATTREKVVLAKGIGIEEALAKLSG